MLHRAALILLLSVGLMYATDSQYLLTAARRSFLAGHNTANINDAAYFATRPIVAGASQPWAESAGLETEELPQELVEYLHDNDAIAFLVAHKGKLVAEEYFQGYHDRSVTNSFSMAKTVVSLLLFIAVREGIIEDINQPLTVWLPEFSEDPLGSKATIGSLSTMSSGYEWQENYYSVFSPTVKLFYGDDVTSYVLGGGFTQAPGSFFYYSSASTQLLAVSLSRALKARNPDATLAAYLSEKLWQPLGMNDHGVWHLDNKGMELSYCCVNTNARNFARLGQLMLQNGVWEGEQLVPATGVESMRTPQADPGYGHGTWINQENTPAFFAMRGHLGQFTIVVPEHDLVVVRLGESMRRDVDANTVLIPFYINQALRLIQGTD
jgi:CubicO group peptidase (beta-lactamase class C family)